MCRGGNGGAVQSTGEVAHRALCGVDAVLDGSGEVVEEDVGDGVRFAVDVGVGRQGPVAVDSVDGSAVTVAVWAGSRRWTPSMKVRVAKRWRPERYSWMA